MWLSLRVQTVINDWY